MKKFFKKFLVCGTAFALTIFCSFGVSAKIYVANIAFVGEPHLGKLMVEKVFGDDHRVPESATNVCGIRLITKEDSVLYKFRSEALRMAQLENASLPECDVVFMIIDFSSKQKINVDDVVVEDFHKARSAFNGSKIILIAMNTECLHESERKSHLENFSSARGFYGKESFDYVLISSDENEESIRERFFNVTDRMVDWRRLPSPGESNIDIFVRLRHLVAIEFEGDPKFKAFTRELISLHNSEMGTRRRVDALEVRTDALDGRIDSLEAHAAATDRRIDATDKRVDTLERDVTEITEALRRFEEEKDKSRELIETLKTLSALLRDMSEGKFNSEEAQRVLDTVDANIRSFDAFATIDSAAGNGGPHDAFDEQVRQEIIKIKECINQDREVINRLGKIAQGFADSTAQTIALNEALMKDRTAWAQEAIKIQEIADSIRRNEEQLKTISKGVVKDFIWQQYKSEEISWWGKWRLRSSFPFLKNLIREEEEQARAKESKLKRWGWWRWIRV